LKNGAFIAMKRDAAFYTRMTKGIPFCSEKVYKREGVGPPSRASP